MPMRYQDNRVGFFNNNKNIYSSSKDKVESKTYINRWRLQPKPEDMDKYFAGELVEQDVTGHIRHSIEEEGVQEYDSES